MHRKHFGDSYDVLKQALLRWLSDLGPWSAHPMFTEASDGEMDAFETFLGVPLLCRDLLSKSTNRRDYFSPCRQARHLFLDPDIGLRMSSRVEGNPAYLYSQEFRDLAAVRPSYLTMTFDQSLSRSGGAADQACAKLVALDLPGFAYVSHVAFIVVGCDAGVVRRGRDVLLARSRLPASRVPEFWP